jgi:hypothetical protein
MEADSEGEEGAAAVGLAAAEAAVGEAEAEGEEETRCNPKLCCTAGRCREGIVGTSDPRHHLG